MKIMQKKIMLLAISMALAFLFAEVFFRAYYSQTGKILAKDDEEFCLKELKLKRLPTDNEIFANFSRTDRWDYDPIIGATRKKNFNKDPQVTFKVRGETVTLLLYDQQHHNSKGMSSINEYSVEKPGNVTRIALFGDSFTCGDQVPILFNMGGLLEKFIPNSEVLNFCVSGKGIETMYARYMLEGKNYSPDIVWFNIFVDDISRPFGCSLEVPNLTIVDGKLAFGPRKYLTPQDVYYNYLPPSIESYFLKHLQKTIYEINKKERTMKKGFVLLSKILDEVQQQTTADNVSFIVAGIQAPNPDKLFIEYYAALEHLVLSKNISFYDSEKYLQNYSSRYFNQSFYYFREGRGLGHFSVIGNSLFAQGMKNFMSSKNLIPKSKDYMFANFKAPNVMLLIPEDFDKNEQNFRVIQPYAIAGNISKVYGIEES